MCVENPPSCIQDLLNLSQECCREESSTVELEPEVIGNDSTVVNYDIGGDYQTVHIGRKILY